MFSEAFINDINKYYEPIDKDTEVQYLKIINDNKESEETKNEYKQKLLYSNLKAILKMAMKYQTVFAKQAVEDLFAEGCIAFILNINKFDADRTKNSSLARIGPYLVQYYVRNAIRNACLDSMEFNQSHQKENYTETTSFDDYSDKQHEVQELSSNFDQLIDEKEAVEQLYKAIEQLEPLQQEIIIHFYGIGTNPVVPKRALAKKLSITPATCEKNYRVAIHKLRRKLSDKHLRDIFSSRQTVAKKTSSQNFI